MLRAFQIRRLLLAKWVDFCSDKFPSIKNQDRWSVLSKTWLELIEENVPIHSGMKPTLKMLGHGISNRFRRCRSRQEWAINHLWSKPLDGLHLLHLVLEQKAASKGETSKCWLGIAKSYGQDFCCILKEREEQSVSSSSAQVWISRQRPQSHFGRHFGRQFDLHGEAVDFQVERHTWRLQLLIPHTLRSVKIESDEGPCWMAPGESDLGRASHVILIMLVREGRTDFVLFFPGLRRIDILFQFPYHQSARDIPKSVSIFLLGQ